jgi:hypothetical protein
MSRQGGKPFDQRSPSNPMRTTGIQIGGPAQRTGLGPPKPIKGMPNSSVRTDKDALHSMMNAPVTKREKVAGAVGKAGGAVKSLQHKVADKLNLSNPLDKAMRSQNKADQKKLGKK